MDTSAEHFLTELAIQRRASPHTIDAYRRDLARLKVLAADADPVALKTPQLRRGLMQLHAQELAPRSIARTLSAWRSYYAWLARRGAISSNPADGLRAPKRPRTLPKALGIDQTAALLDLAPGAVGAGLANEPLQTRDIAMFELFYSSGLRLSELVSLDWPGGLDLAAGEVTVTGKRTRTGGRRQRRAGSMAGATPVRARRSAGAVPRPQRRLTPRRSLAQGATAGRRRACAPPHAAPLVCVACVAVLRRPARGAGNAGPRQHRRDADLYASGFSAPGEELRRRPSAGEEGLTRSLRPQANSRDKRGSDTSAAR
jgi:integrase/recombinase XerC